MDLIYDCPTCSHRTKVRFFEACQSFQCQKCNQKVELTSPEMRKILEICPVCQSKYFYTQRDFPQQVGCLIVLVGAAFVPWTYGFSMLVCAILDFILYRNLKDISVCYQCLTKYRGFDKNEEHQPFDHHVFEQLNRAEDLKKSD